MTDRPLYRRLLPHLDSAGPGLVSLSGGTDSSVLLAALVEAGQSVMAATFSSILHPAAELGRARRLTTRLGVEHLVFNENPLAEVDFKANGPDRCYICKKQRLTMLAEAARVRRLDRLIDGTLAGDADQRRPGLRANREEMVVSPLALAGFDKAAVWQLGRELGLDDWLKPASSCLATRVPYHRPLTEELLKSIGRAEAVAAELLGLEPGSFRIRAHDLTARLELPPEAWATALDNALRPRLLAAVKEAGFGYLALDLAGFRSGSLDEALDRD